MFNVYTNVFYFLHKLTCRLLSFNFYRGPMITSLLGANGNNYTVRAISGADNCIYQKNLSNCHTSTKIGRHVHYSLLFHNRTLATRIFKMAAIFQDGRQLIKRMRKPMRSSKVMVEQSGSLKIPQH